MMSSDDQRQYLVFYLNDDKFAITLDEVREIGKAHQPVFVDRGYPWIDGLINLRGQVITMINVKRRLRMDTAERDERYQVILEENCGRFFRGDQGEDDKHEGGNRELLGLIVDQIGSIITASSKQLSQPPANLREIYQDCLESVLKKDKELISIISMERILQTAH